MCPSNRRSSRSARGRRRGTVIDERGAAPAVGVGVGRRGPCERVDVVRIASFGGERSVCSRVVGDRATGDRIQFESNSALHGLPGPELPQVLAEDERRQDDEPPDGRDREADRGHPAERAPGSESHEDARSSPGRVRPRSAARPRTPSGNPVPSRGAVHSSSSRPAYRRRRRSGKTVLSSPTCRSPQERARPDTRTSRCGRVAGGRSGRPGSRRSPSRSGSRVRVPGRSGPSSRSTPSVGRSREQDGAEHEEREGDAGGWRGNSVRVPDVVGKCLVVTNGSPHERVTGSPQTSTVRRGRSLEGAAWRVTARRRPRRGTGRRCWVRVPAG